MRRNPRPRVLAVLAAALIGTGLTTGAAAAEPAGEPGRYADRTTEFVPLGRPGALAERDAGKQLLLSPHGTRRSIVCRGDGVTVAFYDCNQEDVLDWTPLRPADTPVGEVWFFVP